MRDPKSGNLYLTAKDIITKKEARIYTNWNCTPLSRARDKFPDTILEFQGYSLSEVYRADDDPEDWGQSFCVVIREYTIDSAGKVDSRVFDKTDSNAASYPYEDNEFFGLGRGVNMLVEKWVNIDWDLLEP